MRLPCATPLGVETFDVLTSLIGNTQPDPEYVTAARNMCATCILRDPGTADACLRDAIARGERWVRHVTVRKGPRTLPEPVSNQGRAARDAHAVRREARLEELHAVIARGGDVAEACRALSVSRDALWKWCDKWGHGDVWRALNPRPTSSNQYRRRDDVGEISLRRRRRSRAKGAAA